MRIPTRSARFAASLLIVALLAPAQGLAEKGGQGKSEGHAEEREDEHDGGQQKVKAKGKGRHEVVYKEKGGPPPWAPAHGYRHQYEDDHHGDHHSTAVEVRSEPAVYVAPFGIDLGRCSREKLGAVVGGTLGGLAGSTVGKGTGRTAAIIGGTVIGILVGGSIGRAMDDLDQACVGQILEHAPTGEHVRWVDPDGKTSYDVRPTDTWQDTHGRYCREYQTKATIGGKTQQVYGTACRQPDGSWKIVK